MVNPPSSSGRVVMAQQPRAYNTRSRTQRALQAFRDAHAVAAATQVEPAQVETRQELTATPKRRVGRPSSLASLSPLAPSPLPRLLLNSWAGENLVATLVTDGLLEMPTPPASSSTPTPSLTGLTTVPAHPTRPLPSPEICHFPFSHLPAELRRAIVNSLIDHWRLSGESSALAPYACVSREFQEVVEAHLFACLRVTLERLPQFVCYVRRSRRRCVRKLQVHVELPPYESDPCEFREGWDDKMNNNRLFTDTFRLLFEALAGWDFDDATRGGIAMTFSIWSPSDLRNVTFENWQKRRWNVKDIGEKRFLDSYIDFLGQDEECRHPDPLPVVHAVTSFVTSDLNRRTIMPSAFADIIAKLPQLRYVRMDLVKDKKTTLRKIIFDQLSEIIPRWPQTIETLALSGNTHSSWRDIPHDTIAEKDSGRQLCEALRQFSVNLKHLKIRGLIRIRELLRPIWPVGVEDRFALPPASVMQFPEFCRMETVTLRYGAIFYHHDWRNNSGGNLNENTELINWRQGLSLTAARLAMRMPRLRRMSICQRPLMWAGKHRLEYAVGPRRTADTMVMDLDDLNQEPSSGEPDARDPGDVATLLWVSTFDFKPWDRTLEAWEIVAKKQELELVVFNKLEPDWETDGVAPGVPGGAF